jgi:hypothetical protein
MYNLPITQLAKHIDASIVEGTKIIRKSKFNDNNLKKGKVNRKPKRKPKHLAQILYPLIVK